MDFVTIKALEDTYRLGVYPKRDLAVIRAKGVRIWDSEGREYLDMGASYGVCNVGHCNDEVLSAIKAQLENMIYVSPTFYNDVRARLQERIAGIMPGEISRSFLCNSGTEAVEGAFKLARAHTGRKGLVSAKRAYHGRTMGALSATWDPKYREIFGPLLEDHEFMTFGDIEDAKSKITKDTAAVIVEPVQGEGGVFPAPEGYLKALRDICDDTGALLIADEVQTGLGRTGRMFAVEHDGVVPDIITIAKSLAGGLPMGAFVARTEVCTMPKAGHGSTQSGNPLCSAAAIATIDHIVANDLPARAGEMGSRLITGLDGIAKGSRVIREVRGRGLMAGIELRTKAGKYLSALLAKGIIALPAGTTVIRLLPPLIISEEEIDRFLSTFSEVIEDG